MATDRTPKCSICMSEFTDPVVISCMHAFCRVCIGEYLVRTYTSSTWKKAEIQCPLCHQCIYVMDPIQDKPVEELAGQLKPWMLNLNEKQETTSLPCTACRQIGWTGPAAMWCQVCDVILCDNCVQMHRDDPSTTCHSLDTLEAMVDRRKEFLTAHRERLASRIYRDESLVSERRLSIDDLIKQHQTLMHQIQTGWLGHNDEIKIQRLCEQIDHLLEMGLDSVKADIQMGEVSIQEDIKLSESFDRALSSDSRIDILKLYQIWQAGGLSFCEMTSSWTDRPLLESIKLERTKALKIETRISHRLESAVLRLGFSNGSVKNDTVGTDLFDITTLLVDNVRIVVVVDRYNNCVKAFFQKEKFISTDSFKLYLPHGIASLDENKVIVALPNWNQIVTLEVAPKLVHHSTMNTVMSYFSVAALSPRTIAAGGNKCVDILDMQGQVLRSLATNHDTTFNCPLYMCVNRDGHLLVSDMGTRRIVCLTAEGDVVWIYAPTGENKLTKPGGIATTITRDVLFVEQSSKKVVHLCEEGRYVRDMFTEDDVWCPSSIAIGQDGAIFVNVHQGIKEFWCL